MKDMQRNLTRDLIWASAGYARVGLALLHKIKGSVSNPQVTIGNLAIAIELLLKAFIAKQSLLLLFKNLPLELRCAIAAPEAMPKTFRKAPYEIDLKASTYKSVKLNEAIDTFGIFFPAMKKRLGSHLRFLSRHRNTCVHAALPDFRKYEMERTAFLFLTLVEHLKKEEPELLKYYNLGEDEVLNKQFLERFDEERLNRVHSKVEAAKEKAKELTEKPSLSSDEWDWCPVECPVCGSDGVLEGETNAETDYDAHAGEDYTTLTFSGETFGCEQCGLILEDFDELKIAGIDPDVDRSDEAESWWAEHYDDSDYGGEYY